MCLHITSQTKQIASAYMGNALNLKDHVNLSIQYGIYFFALRITTKRRKQNKEKHKMFLGIELLCKKCSQYFKKKKKKNGKSLQYFLFHNVPAERFLLFWKFDHVIHGTFYTITQDEHENLIFDICSSSHHTSYVWQL